jgi:formate--tetrahydrofolate ligase
VADYVVTEAGFGSDLGGEKFMNIVCRKAGFRPDCVVIVASVRALKMHGGVAREALHLENLGALEKGLGNLKKHIENMHDFGVPVVVAVNHFQRDTAAELGLIQDRCAHLNVPIIDTRVWAHGGKGGEELARAVVETIDRVPSAFNLLYDDSLSLWEKTERIAQEIYGASELEADKNVRAKFRDLQDQGLGHLPICMAKTQYSFSTDPHLLGRPKHFNLQIRDIQVATGAEYLVVYCGDIMIMPGMPRIPAAELIDIDEDGKISGLF